MDITSLEQKAIEYAKRGDFGADAKRVNEELTQAAPDNQGAWTRLARCNIELGLLDDANTALETVLQLNPQNTIARSLLQESIRRSVMLEAPLEPEPRRKRSSTGAVKPKKKAPTGSGATRGFGRPQFAALGQLAPVSAIESLGPTIEPLLMALNERPFAAKVVDARNRAGHSGSRLFRRNSIHGGGDGHLYVFHHGGRWEPQINVGFFASQQWGRAAVRAGIGFNLSLAGSDADRQAGQERAVAYFESFQKLVASEWKQLLTTWMAANGGFIQNGDRQPSVDMLPQEAVTWLIDVQNPVEHEWIFVGRWLFADRSEDAVVMEDPAQLVKWLEQTFVDLLPLWTSVYRNA